jgi:hypothetical protein
MSRQPKTEKMGVHKTSFLVSEFGDFRSEFLDQYDAIYKKIRDIQYSIWGLL